MIVAKIYSLTFELNKSKHTVWQCEQADRAVRDFATHATSLEACLAVADDVDSAAVALASQIRQHLDLYGAETDDEVPCLPYSDFMFTIKFALVAGRLVRDGDWTVHCAFYHADLRDCLSIDYAGKDA